MGYLEPRGFCHELTAGAIPGTGVGQASNFDSLVSFRTEVTSMALSPSCLFLKSLDV